MALRNDGVEGPAAAMTHKPGHAMNTLELSGVINLIDTSPADGKRHLKKAPHGANPSLLAVKAGTRKACARKRLSA